MENMSTVLKPGEISFGVLFFSANTASVTDVFEIIAHMKKTAPIQQFQVIHKVLRNSSISSAYRFTEVFAIDRFVVPI